MTKPPDIDRLIKFDGTKKVGSISYFKPDDVSLVSIQKEYISAISSYFTEDAKFHVRTPFAEDAEVFIYVAEDKLSKKEPKQASKIKRPNVVIKKLPVSITSDGAKNYIDLTKEQRDHWIISVYRAVLVNVSNNGENKPLQEANRVLGKFMQLTKPNEKGEVFLEGDVEPEPNKDKITLSNGVTLELREPVGAFLSHWQTMLGQQAGTAVPSPFPKGVGVKSISETESRIAMPQEYTITFGIDGIGIKDEKKPHWFRRLISFVKNLFKRKKT
jgi:hypothetical protein